MKNNTFKDECDNCGKYDYLKGIDNKCLCPKCIELVNTKTGKIKSEQLNIFEEVKYE